MDHSDAASGRLDILPIRDASDSRPCRARESNCDSCVGGKCELALPSGHFEAIARKGDGLCADRDIGDNDVERLAEPRSVQEALYLLSIRAAAGEGLMDQLLQALFERLQVGLRRLSTIRSNSNLRTRRHLDLPSDVGPHAGCFAAV
jgi:hypothetical protein